MRAYVWTMFFRSLRPGSKPDRPIRFTVDRAGPVSLETDRKINGDGSGTLVNKTVSAGAHCFIWNGVGTHGKKIGFGNGDTAVAFIRRAPFQEWFL